MLTVSYQSISLVMNTPEIFKREDFQAWLNDPSRPTATWHRKGKEPGEYSDVFVLVDANHDGDSSDMPSDVWRSICDTVYGTLCDGDPEMPGLWESAPITVRLTNLAK